MKICELFKNKLTGPTQIVTDHGIRWGVQKQKQSNEKQMGVSKMGFLLCCEFKMKEKHSKTGEWAI